MPEMNMEPKKRLIPAPPRCRANSKTNKLGTLVEPAFASTFLSFQKGNQTALLAVKHGSAVDSGFNMS